ncbi:MAG: hypothetical protein Q8L10_05585 [Candidatus Moranbacteria bacterium]|nr:hypothetical protein [Candidatus Moranbacteria bacterium]
MPHLDTSPAPPRILKTGLSFFDKNSNGKGGAGELGRRKNQTAKKRIPKKTQRKDEKMKRLFLLLLFPLICLFPPSALATLDNFDSYATGFLAGNSYWTQPFVGYESLRVVDNLAYSGPNSVYAYGNPTKTVSATYDDGNTDPNRNVISFYFNVTTLSGYIPVVFDATYQTVYGASLLYFGLFKTSSTTYDFRIDSISPYLCYSYSIIASGLQKNTWHKADIEFNFITKTRRARIDDGAWSTSVNLRYGGLYIKKVQISAPLTTAFSETYIDDFRLTSLNPPQLGVTISPQEGGSVTGDYGIECGVDFSSYCEYEFDPNDSVTLQANPNCGWVFDHWDDGTLCYADNPWTVVMDASKEVEAVFSPIVSTINVIPDTDQGSVFSSEEPPLIHCDDQPESMCSYGYGWDASVELTADPKPGYAFSHWEEGGIAISTERTLSFLAEGSRELVPVFEEDLPYSPIRPTSSTITLDYETYPSWSPNIPHNGIDYNSDLIPEIKSVGKGIVHEYTKVDASGFGAIDPDPSEWKDGPAIWIKHMLSTGEPIYVLYGHSASSWDDQSTGSGNDFVFNCTYAINLQPGDIVNAGSTIGYSAPFYNGGDFQPHLHLSVFKPNQKPDGSYYGPPSSGWGYSELSLDTGDFINPEDFFANYYLIDSVE